LRSWERTVSRLLGKLRLETIRSKILTFAVLATLVPSLSTAWFSYVENKRSLQAKASEELLSVSTQAARELDLWTKERRYDLRVFASSYEVTENLERIPQINGQMVRSGRAYGRLADYLNSVRDRFEDVGVYGALVVVDPRGRPVASSEGAKAAGSIKLPADWASELRTSEWVRGRPYMDSASGREEMVVAVPIRPASGRLLGAFAAKLNLRTLADTLKRFVPGASGRVYLMTDDGVLVVGAGALGPPPPGAQFTPQAARWLLAREGRAVQFESPLGARVVGSARRVQGLNWVVVGEIPAVEAFRQVAHLRNVTLLIVAALFAGVGLLGYFLGLLIVSPLDRLTQGASEVAKGDLDVDLPVVTGGEVGYLTEVFNNMVTRLRESRRELERLSVTDPLTGLYNRRRLMEGLENEIRRARRLKRTFAVLMADVDHFKRYNDAQGHQAGDDVLKRVGAILDKATRDVDVVARYGGEEFFVLMPETEGDGAADVADRIRRALTAERFPGGVVTLSFGVAEFPAHGDAPDALIGVADAALYEAKREGRDRVVIAPGAAARRRRKSSPASEA
jgi:diguanylate cyclase (GGDEF)-like protein